MPDSEVYAQLPRRAGHDDIRLHAKGNGHAGSPRLYHASCQCEWISGEGSATWARYEAIKHAIGLSDMELLKLAEAAPRTPSGRPWKPRSLGRARR